MMYIRKKENMSRVVKLKENDIKRIANERTLERTRGESI